MTLAEEAQRYLAVVEAFRAEGCQPEWRPEHPPHTREEPPVHIEEPHGRGKRSPAAGA